MHQLPHGIFNLLNFRILERNDLCDQPICPGIFMDRIKIDLAAMADKIRGIG